MAQHDYVIANGTGAAVRSDLNGSLAAIVSNNSGATEPGTMYAYQWWPDTTTGLLKIRNAANNAWVTVGTLASTNLGLLPLAGGTMTGALAVTAGTAALPGIAVSGDLNTGITSPGADQVAISTGGTSRVAVSTTAVSSTLAVDVPLGAVGTPSITFTGDLNTGVFSPGADTLALVTAGSNRLHITSAGLVGIGTTSPSQPLHIATSSGSAYIQQTNGTATTYLGPDGSNTGLFGTSTNHDIRFMNNNTERVRIDISGRLLVGTSTALIHSSRNRLNVDSGSGSFVAASFKNDAGSSGQTVDVWNASTTGNAFFVSFFTETASTDRGSIDYNRAAGLIRYNVTSDQRLKSAIQPAASAVDVLSSIQVRSYIWTETGYTVNYGFVAQELNQVLPDAVKAGDDGEEVQDTWAVDNSKVVPLLTKALQEAIAKIEALETRLSALEAA